MDTRRRCPPDSSAARWSRQSANPSSRRYASISGRDMARPVTRRTFSTASSCGHRRSSWNTNPNRSGTPVTVPLSSISNPAIQRRSVVFPRPEGAIRDTTAPSGTVRLTSSSTTLSPKRLYRCAAFMCRTPFPADGSPAAAGPAPVSQTGRSAPRSLRSRPAGRRSGGRSSRRTVSRPGSRPPHR